MPALAHTPRLTPEAFLAWENEQPERHEFVNGEIYAMTGATAAHDEITGNLYSALKSRLVPRGCRVYQQNRKVAVGVEFCYPDVVVQCGPRELNSLLATDPVLIAEVLSGSTAGYDREHKWPLYQRLVSLQTFLMVAQDRVKVEVYRRSAGGWLYTLHETLDSVIDLAEPSLSIPVSELYVGIDGIDPGGAGERAGLTDDAVCWRK